MEGKNKKKKRRKEIKKLLMVLHLLPWSHHLPLYFYSVSQGCNGCGQHYSGFLALQFPVGTVNKNPRRTPEDIKIERLGCYFCLYVPSLYLQQEDFGSSCFLLLRAMDHVKQHLAQACSSQLVQEHRSLSIQAQGGNNFHLLLVPVCFTICCSSLSPTHTSV